MPTTANLGDPMPGDEDLAVLIVRRTTLEWVLRQAVVDQPGVDIRTGARVVGLVAGAPIDGIPVVSGVRLEDGSTVDADLVVVASGRRGPVPAWLDELGVEVPETIHESGLMYLSRWYRLPAGVDLTLDPKLGGDLGFVKYLAVPGDGGTLSVTLAIRTDDPELRAALSDPERFDDACRALPGPDRFFRLGPLQPFGGVRPMGGLLNRIRSFVDDDGRPRVLGIHVVGDAHTCTNPLYGRGCSLAFVQAMLVADALAEHPDDPVARATAYEAGSEREVAPWFHASVEMDRMGADPAGFAAAGGTDGADNPMAAVFVAAATDPIIGRGLTRFWNLLVTPTELATDLAFVGRVAEIMADPSAYPVPPREGPTRTELLAALTSEEIAS
jgi:2-polyprenyl-6-methoxyphenol hydroxylase-like FAD-dependent oxidoreductase